EEIEYLGKIRLREVEEAQQKIAMKIKELSEADEIHIPTGVEEEVYV
ncbi:MAG: flagellar motor switch protein FliG, partial [Actinobacteria bacterium]|nr:flagellar motor switch protein FliG [Actinomycetota bacterium]